MGIVANDPAANRAELSEAAAVPAAAGLPSLSSILERGEAIDRDLVSVVLHGGGLEELVDALTRQVAGLTLVTTTDGRVLADAGGESVRDLLAHPDLFVESGRFRSERFSPGTHQVGGISMAVVAVMAGRVDHGRLVVLRDHDRISVDDVHVLERAATVAALAITKSLAVQAVEAKYRGDFVREVLLDRAGPTSAVVDHFASLLWSGSRRRSSPWPPSTRSRRLPTRGRRRGRRRNGSPVPG